MMKECVMVDVQKSEFREADIPKPADDEVLVKLEYVGVCGSDLHYYEAGRLGDLVVTSPLVLGHEAAGSVVETGKNVKHLKVGDRVALEPGKTCGHCEFCKSGKYNLCKDVIFFATPPVDGVFKEYVAHEADLCFKLPDNVGSMEGALIEPLAVGFHAANQAEATTGKSAIVFGSGCIGLVTLLALKAKGVTRVCVVDLLQKRLDKALELGASRIVNASKEDVLKLAEEESFDIAIETAGTEATTAAAIKLTKKGGVVVLVGYDTTGKMTLPVSMLLDKELTVKTVFRYRNIYPMAIEAVRSGAVNIKGIVTDVFDFDDIAEGLDRCIHDKENIIKAVIKM